MPPPTKTRDDTKDRLIAAATTVLKTRGYSGASARAIANEAGVNSALVFYHFGGVDQLLLAALDRSSADRMELHKETVASVKTVDDLADAAGRIYLDDLSGGHITIFSELAAASIAKPALRSAISERAAPWIEFIESTLERVIGGTPLAKLIPPKDLANAAITFYLGANLFTVIDEDRSRTDSVLAMVRRVAPRAKLLTMRMPGRRRTSKPSRS